MLQDGEQGNEPGVQRALTDTHSVASSSPLWTFTSLSIKWRAWATAVVLEDFFFQLLNLPSNKFLRIQYAHVK